MEPKVKYTSVASFALKTAQSSYVTENYHDSDGDVLDEIVTLAVAINDGRQTGWSDSDVLRVLYRAADEILILRTRARKITD